MTIECDAVEKDAPLRQGDIFKFLDKKDLWENFGIIITTDCDIARGKNSDVYSYCPIINISHYFHQVYLPRIIDFHKILEKTKETIDKQYSNNGSKGVDIGSISPWIIDRGVENVLDDVNIHSKERNNNQSTILRHWTSI